MILRQHLKIQKNKANKLSILSYNIGEWGPQAKDHIRTSRKVNKSSIACLQELHALEPQCADVKSALKHNGFGASISPAEKYLGVNHGGDP